ncbi:MarR family winged helix-turn-helix transcriptional regulator [Corynebacterium uterequi]|uniref:Transcriptional regulator n=1 Tax=Corynebacterium uterequi TaxID=1072256 RepID=A0A0G3HI95_9CORY|nr:MarR family transcriptional regulator [Corynebacterium uterequi]AKK10862.1 transcriptional regulator [Corynebacterium uterequi]
MTSEPRWLNDEEQSLWRLMLAASRKVDRVMDDTLQAGSELSTSEFSVLVCLSEAGDCQLRLRDLCVKLDWDRSRTSHQITRMERRGLVLKRKSEGDARGVVVTLTDDGMRRLKAAAPEHVESVRRVAFDHMTEEQARVMRSYCEAVLAVSNVPGAEGFAGRLCSDVPLD